MSFDRREHVSCRVPMTPCVSEFSSLVEQGKLEVVVDSRHALGDFPVAFERLESHRAKGKVLIEFDPSLG